MTSWRLRLLLACLTCLSLSSGSSLTSAAAHGGPSCRPAVLTHGLRLHGGQEAPPQPLTLRLNSRDGIKRIKTPGGHITLSMLQQIIRTQLHIPPSKQHVSLQPGGDLLDMSGEQTLAELGLKQGSMLHLASNIGVDTVSADKAARRASSTLRRVSMDVTADKTLLKVALVPAPAAPCQFVSIDARAWQNFAAYLIDTEMELMRVALLFGRVTTGDGVQVSRGTWPHRASAPAHQRTSAPECHRTMASSPHTPRCACDSFRRASQRPLRAAYTLPAYFLRLHVHTHTRMHMHVHMHVHMMFMYVAGGRLLRAAAGGDGRWLRALADARGGGSARARGASGGSAGAQAGGLGLRAPAARARGERDRARADGADAEAAQLVAGARGHMGGGGGARGAGEGAWASDGQTERG